MFFKAIYAFCFFLKCFFGKVFKMNFDDFFNVSHEFSFFKSFYCDFVMIYFLIFKVCLFFDVFLNVCLSFCFLTCTKKRKCCCILFLFPRAPAKGSS